MRPVRLTSLRPSRATAQRLRTWASPAAAILLSFFCVLLPPSGREAIGSVLEHTVFFPFRAALGWGPRSLLAEKLIVSRERARADLRGSEDRAREASAENEQLRRLLGLGRRTEMELVPGVVVSRSRGRLGDVLWVRHESQGPLAIGLPVVSAEGLLGRVGWVDGDLARVEGLENPNVAVSVLDQRSREEGIARWSPGARWPLWVQGVPAQADWQLGDRVVTSGLGTVFPKGLLVGHVVGSESEEMGRLRRIGIRPAASADRVEVVFFVTGHTSEAVGTDAGEPEISLYPIDPERALSRLPLTDRAFASGPVPAP